MTKPKKKITPSEGDTKSKKTIPKSKAEKKLGEYFLDPKKLRRKKEDFHFNNWAGTLAANCPSYLDDGAEKVKRFLSPPVPPYWIPERTVINFFLSKFESGALEVLKNAGHEIDITEENIYLHGDLTSQQEEFERGDIQLASANRVLLSAYSIRQIIFDEDPLFKAERLEDALFEMMQLTACVIKAKLGSLIEAGIDGLDSKLFKKNAGKAKKGHIGEMKKLIATIARIKKSYDFKTILKVFKDDSCDDGSDLMNDLRCARENPIDIKIQEVYEDKKTVGIIEDGKGKDIAFKRIKNILSELKKNPVKQTPPVNPAIKKTP